MKYNIKHIYRGVLASTFILLSGCSSTNSEPSPESLLNIKVISVGTATPIPIYFFTLKSDDSVKKLDYFEWINKKNSNFNGALINRSKTILLPGKSAIFQTQLTDNLQYYAVIVGFKDVEDNDNWRYIQKIIPHGNNNIALKISQTNAYSSNAIKKITKYTDKIKGNVSNRISSRVNNEKNKVVDKALDRVFGRIF